MRKLKSLVAPLLAFALTFMAILAPTGAHRTALAQGSTALERGYRTGYSDGYNAGYKDVADKAARDYQNKTEYQKADRAYVEVWGPLEDYRDGYQQGYETGYAAGYDRQPFNSAIPTGFKRRGNSNNSNTSTDNSTSSTPDNSQNSSTPPTTNQPASSSSPSSSSGNMSGTFMIPHDSMLVVELEGPISTDVNQRGDPFQARLVDPRDFSGAMVSGHIARLQRAGKVKGNSELQLNFEQIRLPDGRTAALHAEVVEVIGASSNSGVGNVDREGGVKGRDSTKDDITKVGAATGVGAIVGAIIGGGKGAAIGAAVGAGVGTGGVLSTRGKDIRLERGQQLKIRTSTDTNIQ